jgi:hypothetical protein
VKGVFLTGCAILAAAAMLFAGCGDSDDATASLTRAEFIKQGNAICKKGEKERGKVLKAAFDLYNQGEKVTRKSRENLVVNVLVEPYRKMTGQLADLGAPEGDEAKVEAIIKSMEKSAKDAEQEPLTAFDSIAPFAESNKLNKEYGLTSCAI